MLSPAFVEIRDALAQAPYVAHIECQDDYEQALELMDQLVDDYDANRLLIEILAVSIERWEDQAAEFSDFNAAVAELCGVRPHVVLLHQMSWGLTPT
jgi:HTH-type transcriptional regulator/antitoxin HigA